MDNVGAGGLLANGQQMDQGGGSNARTVSSKAYACSDGREVVLLERAEPCRRGLLWFSLGWALG